MKKPAPLATRLIFIFTLFMLLTTVVGFSSVYFVLEDTFNKLKRHSLTGEVREWATIYAGGAGHEVLKAEFNNEVEVEGNHRVLCRLFSQDGTIILSSSTESWQHIPQRPPQLARGETYITKLRDLNDNFLVTFYRDNHDLTFCYALSLKDERRFLTKYRQVSIWITIISLLIVFPLIYKLIHNEMLGVAEVAKASEDASHTGDFSKRVQENWRSFEVHTLATSFNVMQEEINNLMNELKEVSNNIAHDIRSPLTRMRGTAETTMLGNNQSVECYQNMGENIVIDCDRLIFMISTMLEIVEAESTKLVDETVDIKELVRGACEIFVAAAELNDISLCVKISDEALKVKGNKSQLQRMLGNLLDNACKYCGAGDTIYCSVEIVDENIVVSVRDTGPGITPSEHEVIFDRFYRCDQSRSSDGNGLGLSYVKTIVRRHNGHIELVSEPGIGSRFSIFLPQLVVNENFHIVTE